MLLFGEYTIIDGGIALSRPLRRFQGYWTKSSSSSDLISFFNYLKTIKGYRNDLLDKAINENWVFESSIPLGFGLGSSGALCAAAHDAFFDSSYLLSHEELKGLLGQSESFFHGSSSGLDPLTSFLDRPVLSERGVVKTIEDFRPEIRLSLLDSKKSRVTKPLVEFYINRKETEKAFENFSKQMNEINVSLINSYLENKHETFDYNFKKLSWLQFENMARMIPSKIKTVWEKGLNNNSYFLKLSGAGGGGFFLVYGDLQSFEKGSLITL